ncbi:MAG: hypothetical protein IJH87_04495, partial [Atopobiaceae bacterium]|nr:hypothetical protein [Atopobiaceae bacterium]
RDGFLRETDYRLDAFRSWCPRLAGKRIALYGTGANARRILESLGASVSDGIPRISAIIDDGARGEELFGLRVLSLDEALPLGLDAIIIAAEPKSAAPIAKRLHNVCHDAGIELLDMFGNDLARLGERVDSIVRLGFPEQLAIIEGADTLCVDMELFIDAHFQKPVDECLREGHGLRECMRYVIESALEQGKRVVVYSPDMELDAEQAWRILTRAGFSDPASENARSADGSDSRPETEPLLVPELLLANEAGLWIENGLYRLIYGSGEPRSSERVVHVGSDLFRDCYVPLVYGKDAILAGDIKDSYSYKLALAGNEAHYAGDWFTVPGLRPANEADERLRACAESVMPSIRESIGEAPARIASIVAPLVVGYTTWLVKALAESSKEYREVLFASRDAYIVRLVYDLFRQSIAETGFLDADLPPSRYFYTSRKASLAASEDHDGSTGERANTLAYFDACGFEPDASYAFVEFVGAGTCQRQLESFAPFRITGFYFGSRLVPYSVPTFDSHWWFADGETAFLSRFLFLEPFLSSDEPSLVGFGEGGCQMFAEERRSKAELDLLHRVHEGILAFAREYATDWYRRGDVIDHAFVDSIMPGLDDCELSGMLLYDDLAGEYMDRRLFALAPKQQD